MEDSSAFFSIVRITQSPVHSVYFLPVEIGHKHLITSEYHSVMEAMCLMTSHVLLPFDRLSNCRSTVPLV